MTPEALEQFAKYGGYIGLLMGVIVVGMSTAFAFLWREYLAVRKELREVQNERVEAEKRRVEDAKNVHGEIVGLAEDTNKAITAMSGAMTAMRDAVLIRDR